MTKYFRLGLARGTLRGKSFGLARLVGFSLGLHTISFIIRISW